MNKSILFVDDEKPILRSIIRLFMQTDYRVFTADNGEYALEILSNNNIDMIVSDMRMPEMSGYELLNKVKEQYPAIVRLILSGYADESLIKKALQTNSASAYIFKPWVNDEFIAAISNIFSVQDMINYEEKSAISNELEMISRKLIVFNKVRKTARDGDIDSLINIIRENKSFEKSILDIAMSAFVNISGNSLEKAIDDFGLYNIQNICLINNLLECMYSNDGSTAKEDLLKYVCTVNLIVELIYTKVLKRNIPDMSQSIGLIHALGRIMEPYCNESNILEFCYAKIGACLSKYLDLPYVIQEVNLFSHNPLDERVINKEQMAILHLAMKYTAKLLYKEDIEITDSQLFRFLHINHQECNMLLAEASNRIV